MITELKRMICGSKADSYKCKTTRHEYDDIVRTLPTVYKLARMQRKLAIVYDLHADKVLMFCNGLSSHYQPTFQAYSKENAFDFFASIESGDKTAIESFYAGGYRFLENCPAQERCNYMQAFDFHWQSPAGQRLHFVQQNYVYHSDRKGKPWFLLLIIYPFPRVLKGLTFRHSIINIEQKRLVIPSNIQFLTLHELSLLDLIDLGFDNEAIASHYGIAYNTVNNHRSNILVRTDTSKIEHAILRVRITGLL